ncbi:response regulator transcription factor [Pelomicrobium sp.]|jgi:DNA-binding NarL/FixJ family response regulator|uniref:response regulator transcription factor n=1 Tax=Pelomicrobium sp. TaxID=2815319 RepID=UPI002FDEA350
MVGVRVEADAEQVLVVKATTSNMELWVISYGRPPREGAEPEALACQLQGIHEGRPPLSPAVTRRILLFFRQTKPDLALQETVALTSQQREVLALLAHGLSLAEAARMLAISHHTVGDHVKHIYRKLNITSRAEAALRAKNLGLL